MSDFNRTVTLTGTLDEGRSTYGAVFGSGRPTEMFGYVKPGEAAPGYLWSLKPKSTLTDPRVRELEGLSDALAGYRPPEGRLRELAIAELRRLEPLARKLLAELGE